MNGSLSPESEMAPKKLCWKLSPEMGDGSSFAIVETPSAALEALREWLTEGNARPGDCCLIDAVEMTKEEIDALPDL